jgi:hypothetical protein
MSAIRNSEKNGIEKAVDWKASSNNIFSLVFAMSGIKKKAFKSE